MIFDNEFPVSKLGTSKMSAFPATSPDIFLIAAASGETALSNARGP